MLSFKQILESDAAGNTTGPGIANVVPPLFSTKRFGKVNDFHVPEDHYLKIRNGRDRYSRWDTHLPDEGIRAAVKDSLYKDGCCLVTNATSGASVMLKHKRVTRFLKDQELTMSFESEVTLEQTRDLVSERIKTNLLPTVFLVDEDLEIDAYVSAAMMGAKKPVKKGFTIQDNRMKDDHDKVVSVYVFDRSKHIVGYVRAEDWAGALNGLVTSDKISLVDSDIPGMENMFESYGQDFVTSNEFIKESTMYEFDQDEELGEEYLQAYSFYNEIQGKTENESDVFAQIVACFFDNLNSSEDVTDSVDSLFGAAVTEIKAGSAALGLDDVTAVIIQDAKRYIDTSYDIGVEEIEDGEEVATESFPPSKDKRLTRTSSGMHSVKHKGEHYDFNREKEAIDFADEHKIPHPKNRESTHESDKSFKPGKVSKL